MKLVFKHARATENIGDRWCSPYDHLPDLWQGHDAKALDLAEPTPETDAIIYGGGKITGGIGKTMMKTDKTARARIGWGISTVQSSWFAPRYWQSYRRLTLIGTRDWGDNRFEYVPCASSMAPDFVNPLAPEHDVVVYLHHWKSPGMGMEVPEGIPTSSNRGTSLTEALKFIASGATVVSNSYHGTFWGLLMGRRVLCVPFSGKFSKFRVSPGFATASDWTRRLSAAQGSDELHGLCVDATRKFSDKVMNTLNI